MSPVRQGKRRGANHVAGGALLQGRGSYEPPFQAPPPPPACVTFRLVVVSLPPPPPHIPGLFCQAITGPEGPHGADTGTKNESDKK